MADSDAPEATGKPGSRKRAQRKGPGGDRELAVALSHRLRRQLLRSLERSSGDPRSAMGLSKQLNVSVCSVNYHVGVLARCGCVAQAGERRSRHAVRHVYVSKLADNPVARAVLEQTRVADEG